MVQKFRKTLQIGVELNFRDKNFVITCNFGDSMLTHPFFSERAIDAKILRLMYSRIPDFKQLSAVTKVPDHRATRHARRWDSFRYPRQE